MATTCPSTSLASSACSFARERADDRHRALDGPDGDRRDRDRDGLGLRRSAAGACARESAAARRAERQPSATTSRAARASCDALPPRPVAARAAPGAGRARGGRGRRRAPPPSSGRSVGRVLEDRGAREAEEEGRGEVPRRRRAAQAVAREDRLDRPQHPRWRRSRAPAAGSAARSAATSVSRCWRRQKKRRMPEHDRRGARRRAGPSASAARLDVARQPLEARLERRAVQLVLGREVEVDRPLADPGARRHLAHLHAVEVALGEHGGGGGEDALALVVVGMRDWGCRPELTGQF